MCASLHRLAGIGLICLLSAPAQAQLKTEKVLSYEVAKIIGTTAVETCMSKGYAVSATVVDRDGQTVLQLRGDGARPHTMENSRRKAYTANTFRVPSAQYAKRFADGDPGVRQQTSLPGVIAIAGGLPIKVGDEVIGGAAISGSPSGNDEVCVQAGLDKVKDMLK